MKKLLLSTLLLCSICVIKAQQAFESSTSFKKANVPSIQIEANSVEKISKKSVMDNLERRIGKSKDEKGFSVFKGVRVPEIGPDVYDIYVMVDKLKANKEKSIITMMVSMGNENFVSNLTNPEVFNNAKRYVEGMLPWVASGDLERQIKDQEDEIKKAEKKYNNSIDDGNDLQKRKANIERDIEQNKNDQATKKNELEKQRQILEALKMKRN
jgi:hypothetical protein